MRLINLTIAGIRHLAVIDIRVQVVPRHLRIRAGNSNWRTRGYVSRRRTVPFRFQTVIPAITPQAAKIKATDTIQKMLSTVAVSFFATPFKSSSILKLSQPSILRKARFPCPPELLTKRIHEPRIFHTHKSRKFFTRRKLHEIARFQYARYTTIKN